MRLKNKGRSKIVFILALLFMVLPAFSQSDGDSLKIKLKYATDTIRINILNKLSAFYSEREDSVSIYYANEAIALSEKLNFMKGKAMALNNKGIVYDVIGNYDSALYYYNSSLEIADAIHNLGLKANVNNNIGLVFWNKGEYEKALKCYFISLKIFENLKTKKGIANVYSNIGLIYSDLGKLKESLDFHFQSLRIKEGMNDNYGIGVSLTNIGNTYQEMDSISLAIKYYERSIKFKNQSNDLYGLAIAYNDIGTAYATLRNRKEALKYHLLALPIREKLNDEYGLITTCNNLAELYRINGEYKTSLFYCLKSLGLAQKLKSNTKLKVVYLFLSDYYKDVKDYQKSLFFYEKYDLIKDSIYSNESNRNITEMQTKYLTEKKEQQLQLKTLEFDKQKYRNKIQIILFISFALLIFVTSLFFIYRNKQRQIAEQISENNRQEKLRFKAVIDSEEKERIRIAKELHDGLGQLLSSAKLNISSLEDGIPEEDEYLLENSLKIIDEAVTEVRNISHNLMPATLMSYGLIEAIGVLVNKINDSKQIGISFNNENFNATLEIETKIALYRITQEVINNMLKHSQAKNIDIRLSNFENRVSLAIKDNGIGFNTAEIKNSKGIGWQNIYSRVSILNGEINVNSHLGNGTEIFIEIIV